MKVIASKRKLEGLSNFDMPLCESCVLWKQKAVSFSKHKRNLRAEKLEFVHTDVCGPSDVPSLNDSYYYITFVDDSTRKLWVYFAKHKSDVFEAFKRWKSLVENETGLKLKCLRSDNGGEYCSKELGLLCRERDQKRKDYAKDTST